MKTFKMCFGHPVEGRVFLTNMDKDKYVFTIKTDNKNILEVPLQRLKKGKWKITFEWEYHGRDYSHAEEILID